MNPGIIGVVALLITGIMVFTRLFWQRHRAKTCEYCYFPHYKCVCPGTCKHPTTTTIQWTQDGWAARCIDCREVLYLGDNYDGGPKR